MVVGGRLRVAVVVVTPALAHRWLHARARGSASGAPSSLGGGVVTKVDECLSKSTRGELGYVVTGSSRYVAGGMAGNLIQNEVVGDIRDLPGAREFHVPDGSTSFGYTLPLKGRYTGGCRLPAREVPRHHLGQRPLAVPGKAGCVAGRPSPRTPSSLRCVGLS